MHRPLIVVAGALVTGWLLAVACTRPAATPTPAVPATPTAALTSAVAQPTTPLTTPAAPTSAPSPTAAAKTAATPSPAPPASPTPQIVEAASAFLASLNPTLRQAAVFEFSNNQAKAQWSNLPVGNFNWIGVRWGDLNDTQRQALDNLLRVSLSDAGYTRLQQARAADEVLRQQGGQGNMQFGSDFYFAAFFGTPSTTQPWMFRFGGHHMTVNISVAGENVAMTPSFPGCQPCNFVSGGQTVQPVGSIIARSFRLLGALDASQRQQAVRGTSTIDLVLGPAQAMRSVAPEGLRVSSMNADQQALLLELVSEYTGMLNEQSAAARLAEVRAGLADTYFAWYGPTTEGSAAYFRIQGPQVWIEFAPQGGPGQGKTGGAAQPAAGGPDHVHTIYRDPTNDYGVRWAQ